LAAPHASTRRADRVNVLRFAAAGGVRAARRTRRRRLARPHQPDAGVLAERRLYIDFAGPAPELEISGVTVRARSARSLELAFDPSRIPTPKLIAAIAAEHAVEDIHVDEPAIEEVIARFYDLHDAGEA
jgi:hypothetical protein